MMNKYELVASVRLHDHNIVEVTRQEDDELISDMFHVSSYDCSSAKKQWKYEKYHLSIAKLYRIYFKYRDYVYSHKRDKVVRDLPWHRQRMNFIKHAPAEAVNDYYMKKLIKKARTNAQA